jgi:hypothetical protein
MRGKKYFRILLPLLTISLLFRGFFVSDAYAYLDPSTGTIVFQALIGVLVGVGITLKIYWTKLKFAIYNKRNKSDNE